MYELEMGTRVVIDSQTQYSTSICDKAFTNSDIHCFSVNFTRPSRVAVRFAHLICVNNNTSGSMVTNSWKILYHFPTLFE